MKIERIIREIGMPDPVSAAAAAARWNRIAKPLGSLGWFEAALVRMAALRGTADFRLDRRTLLVFCADNGVVEQGVTQCGSEVTASVATALAENRSTASAMAAAAGCRIIPADMGIRDYSGHPGVRNLRVRNGTGDISREAAMSREECLLAMERGAELAGETAKEGTDLLAVGEMGIGNTTTAAAVASVLLNRDPQLLAGRGAGLGGDGLARKREVLCRARERCRVSADDPVGLLSELGGLDLAAMCGAFLGAAANRIPVLADGMISLTAALCAVRLCPQAKSALFASHVSAEPAGGLLLEALGLTAPITAGMFLGEGGGALMLIPLLEQAWGVYSSGQSFEKLGIEAYRPFPVSAPEAEETC